MLIRFQREPMFGKPIFSLVIPAKAGIHVIAATSTERAA